MTAEEVWIEALRRFGPPDWEKAAASVIRTAMEAYAAEKVAEERAAIVAWLINMAQNDLAGAAHCRSGNAGQMLRRFAQRRRDDARAIASNQHHGGNDADT